MAIASAAQALASEQEWVRPELEDLALSSSILWKRMGKNTQVKPVSDRPSRIPTMPSRGGKPRVGNMNGSDMGIGSGPTQVPGQLTTVCYIHAFSYTGTNVGINQRTVNESAAVVEYLSKQTFPGQD